MAVTTLYNIQVGPDDRKRPDQMWPLENEQETDEQELPDENQTKRLAASVQFLKNLDNGD